MAKLLRAGLMAGALQLGAVVTMTLFVSFLASPDIADEAFWTAVSPFLMCAYLLVAVGLVFTRGRSVDRTAKRIRHASTTARLAQPANALMVLAVQCGLAATLFVMFALRAPPSFLEEAMSHFELAHAASLLWAAGMSIGVAGFGANAHAAIRAALSLGFSP